MADTDVIGIVSLLLAAGGAAYLFRARVLGQRAAAAEEEASARAEEKKVSSAREQATIPPTLRPASEPKPKPKSKVEEAKKPTEKPAPEKPNVTVPETPRAKVESKSEPEPDRTSDEPPPSTQPEAVTPPQEPPKPAVIKSKLPESKPAVRATKGQAIVLPPSPNKKPTITGVPPPANEPKKEAPSEPKPQPKPKAKKESLPNMEVDVPQLAMDEDEDVEPTRVGRYERQSIRPPIERHVFDKGADADSKTRDPLALVVYALAQTDPGRRRKQNEDSFLVRDKYGLYAVADGMGGHRGGEFASKLAVDTLSSAFEKSTFEAEAHADLPPEASELARAIQMANAAILAEAGRKPELKGMGTTLCAARFVEQNRRLFIGHVGDSRCYRLRNGVMTQMTKDHTMADYGIAGPEGAHLSRALGVWPTVPIDVIMATPQLGDVYLICSDGLTKMLTNETIQTQLQHEEDPKAAVERLVFFANAHGGKDNITIILLRVVESGWKPPSERNVSTSS